MQREADATALRRSLRRYPGVAMLGPRQVGKTVFARSLAEIGGSIWFDLPVWCNDRCRGVGSGGGIGWSNLAA